MVKALLLVFFNDLNFPIVIRIIEIL